MPQHVKHHVICHRHILRCLWQSPTVHLLSNQHQNSLCLLTWGHELIGSGVSWLPVCSLVHNGQLLSFRRLLARHVPTSAIVSVHLQKGKNINIDVGQNNRISGILCPQLIHSVFRCLLILVFVNVWSLLTDSSTECFVCSIGVFVGIIRCAWKGLARN